MGNEPPPITREITVTEGISVKDLAEKLEIRAKDLVGTLLIGFSPYIRDLLRRRIHSQNGSKLLVLLFCYMLSVAIFTIFAK